MDALFEFLFKYRPVVFERGTFAFSAGWPVFVLLASEEGAYYIGVTMNPNGGDVML